MNQRKKPDLTPLDRSDEDLDRLAEITMDDIEKNMNWSAVTENREAKAYLEAPAEDEDE